MMLRLFGGDTDMGLVGSALQALLWVVIATFGVWAIVSQILIRVGMHGARCAGC